MRNPHLYEILKDYCMAVFTFIRENFKGTDNLPSVIKEKIQISDEGFSQAYVREVEWFMVIYKHWEEFKKMPHYPLAIQAMEEDEKISKHLNKLVGTATAKGRVDCDRCLQSFFIHLIQKQNSLDFPEAVLNNVYDEFEGYFYRDVLEFRYLSLLDRFKMETEKIQLNPGFSLIKVSNEEKEELISESRSFFASDFSYHVYFRDYALDYYFEEPKVFGDEPGIYREAFPDRVVTKNFDDICSTLRLFKRGNVGYSNIRKIARFWHPYGGTTVSGLPSREVYGEEYVLLNNEIPAFLDLWKLFQKIREKKRNRIEIALRRFNFAYTRLLPEDKLIDYIIGFEALLLKKDESQEFSYRLALRGSALLGKTTEDRRKIFAELKTAYNERSALVHGRETKEFVGVGGERVQFREFVNRVEEYLRFTINKFLELCENKGESQVIKDLDENIVAGSYINESAKTL